MHDSLVNHRAEPVGGGGGGGGGQGEGVTVLYKLGSCSAKRCGFSFNPFGLELSVNFRVWVWNQPLGLRMFSIFCLLRMTHQFRTWLDFS